METNKKITIELIKQSSGFYVLDLHLPGAVPLLSREMSLDNAEKTANIYRKACGLLQKYQVTVLKNDTITYDVEAEDFIGALIEVEKICAKYAMSLVSCISIRLL